MAETINILLIEDNPGDRQLIMQEFRSLGYDFNFRIKTDGEEAIKFLDEVSNKKIKTEMPHLIILDFNLPRASGIEILKQYKQHPIMQSTPIIVFSTSASMQDVQSAYANNANCYIVKPFDYDDFSKAIRSIWEFWFNISRLNKHVILT